MSLFWAEISKSLQFTALHPNLNSSMQTPQLPSQGGQPALVLKTEWNTFTALAQPSCLVVSVQPLPSSQPSTYWREGITSSTRTGLTPPGLSHNTRLCGHFENHPSFQSQQSGRRSRASPYQHIYWEGGMVLEPNVYSFSHKLISLSRFAGGEEILVWNMLVRKKNHPKNLGRQSKVYKYFSLKTLSM